ncbi:hypothetical protein I8752_35835 [Nostocaceae cyanobacterium CENA369]|uniref:Uncharacterized protein n=1 Tax=Dendronalium phyllosphericum CENA369 TaxID=1725256 RepID=A0A8J7LL87_9NOST|nr:hypothetical protein [Dendronalium phyllosphericum]MBH8578224.1 hypothetical protein [Dendronalium phyllosphericum CENA369]
MKQYFSLEIESPNAQNVVETYAQLKRKCPAFSFRTSDFNERWQAFKHFYDAQFVQYTGQQFLIALAEHLKINLDDVPRSTRYYWFSQAELSFSAQDVYHSKDLALVAFVAAKWAINKRSQTMKSANISVLAIAE